jgi:hypothetical protein
VSRTDESRRGAELQRFTGGWARVPTFRAESAHHYEIAAGGWLVSTCGAHKSPPCKVYAAGHFHRCLRCQRGLLVRNARPE